MTGVRARFLPSLILLSFLRSSTALLLHSLRNQRDLTYGVLAAKIKEPLR
jgi:hypothetical protein